MEKLKTVIAWFAGHKKIMMTVLAVLVIALVFGIGFIRGCGAGIKCSKPDVQVKEVK